MHRLSSSRLLFVASVLALVACTDGPTAPVRREFQQPITVAGTDPNLAMRTEDCPNRCMIVIDYSAVAVPAGTPPMGRSSPGRAGAISSLNENAVIVTEGGIVWSKSATRTLLPLPGRAWVYAKDINDYGQVAGSSVSADLIWRATVWEPSGQALDVGTFGGDHSRANAINDLPQVVGSAQRTDGQEHAFIWTWNDGLQPLSGMPAAAVASDALDINDQGQVVGYYHVSPREHAFVWSAAMGLVTLPEPEGTERSMAVSINAVGWIVGSVSSALGGRAALWKPRGDGSYEYVDVGALEGDVRGAATGVNHWGEVTGTSSLEFHSPTRDLAFVWYAGDMVALSDQVSSTRAINSWGDIVGRANTELGPRNVVWAWPENVHRWE